MIRVSRVIPMIHVWRMVIMMLISRMIPVATVIPAAAENTPGRSEQGHDSQNEQDNFHMPNVDTSLGEAAMGC